MKISKFLATTSAIALFGFAGAASAATLTTAFVPANTPASELFGTGALPIGAASTVTVTTTAAQVGAKRVTFTLNNAVFSAALADGSLTGTCAGAKAIVSGGTVGSSTVTYSIAADAGCGAGSTLILAVPALQPTTALGTAGTNVTMTALLTDAAATPAAIDGAMTGSPITLMTSAKATSLAAVAGGANTVLAANGFTQFAAPNATTAILGTVRIPLAAGALRQDLGGAFTLVSAGATTSGTLTVRGDFSAMIADPAGDCTNGVYIDVNTNGTCETADLRATSVTANTAVFNLNLAQLESLAAAPLNLRVILDGTTQLRANTYTIEGTITYQNANFRNDTFTATNVGSIAIDGSAVTIPFHLAATDSGSGYTSRVRLVNTNASNATVRVSVIGDNGVRSSFVVLNAANTTGLFPGNATAFDGATNNMLPGRAVELTNAQIETITGTTLPTSTRARVTFVSTVSGLQASPYMVQPGGVLGQIDATTSP